MAKYKLSHWVSMRLSVAIVTLLPICITVLRYSQLDQREKRSILASTEIPVEFIDPASIDLTPLVNTLINASHTGSQHLFSVLSVTSHSSLALHKLTLLVYNISNFQDIETSMFPTRYCYCVTNTTNDLTDFTAILLDVMGNSTSYLQELFKSSSILSVSQRNSSDCTYICVMAGKTDKDLSLLWESVTPLFNHTIIEDTHKGNRSHTVIPFELQPVSSSSDVTLSPVPSTVLSTGFPKSATTAPVVSIATQPMTTTAAISTVTEHSAVDSRTMQTTDHMTTVHTDVPLTIVPSTTKTKLPTVPITTVPAHVHMTTSDPVPMTTHLTSARMIASVVPTLTTAVPMTTQLTSARITAIVVPTLTTAVPMTTQLTSARMTAIVVPTLTTAVPMTTTETSVPVTTKTPTTPMDITLSVVTRRPLQPTVSRTTTSALRDTTIKITTTVPRPTQSTTDNTTTSPATTKVPPTDKPGCPWRSELFYRGSLREDLKETRNEDLNGNSPTVSAMKLQPCVFELCKFFSQCLCRGFSHKTFLQSYCIDSHFWYEKHTVEVCSRVRRVAFSRNLKQKCLARMCVKI